jgi:hypothetical protein
MRGYMRRVKAHGFLVGDWVAGKAGSAVVGQRTFNPRDGVLSITPHWLEVRDLPMRPWPPAGAAR